MQMGIILFFSACTGLAISWVATRLLFSSPLKKAVALKAGHVLQQEFESSTIIDEQMANPLLFENLKPEIEKHVDFFLNEKLAIVFPLLYKFMGEKTLMQFKNAFMIEIDLLFPVIIRNYMATLKKEIRLDTIISQRINAIPGKTIQAYFMKYAKKEIFYFREACCLIGLMMGILTVICIHFAF